MPNGSEKNLIRSVGKVMLWISDIGNGAIEVYRTAAPVLDFNLHPSGVNYQPAWYRLDINEISKPSDGYWTDQSSDGVRCAERWWFAYNLELLFLLLIL